MGNGEKKGFLTVKEVAKRTGLSIPTLRYYDREGLTPQISRSAGGIRQYTEEDVCWLELICCLKHSGMALSDIRKFVGLCLEGEDGVREKKEVLLKQKEHILAQIRQLLCSLELIECKLKNYREIGASMSREISQKRKERQCSDSVWWRRKKNGAAGFADGLAPVRP